MGRTLDRMFFRKTASTLSLLALGACAHRQRVELDLPPDPAPAARPVAVTPKVDSVVPPKQRVAPPEVALQLGLMPNASTGVTSWRLQHPTYDGRGVLIAILDSGVDPGIAGLQSTTRGENKILDVRDLSGEGNVPLTGNADGTWTGVLRELPFGTMPQADFNGNGTNRDSFRIVVARDSAGWKARIDANGDGSLDDEPWLRDFLVHRETFTFASARVARGHGPITAAFNLAEENGRPLVAVYLDTSGHGSHVAGIASGYNIYGVSGFHGVAPGAQIIGVRIADNARGNVSTTGSMARGMEYAWRFAQERRMPLVINLSFGVGNADEARATIDSIVDAFLVLHPDVFFAIAAGNDGPGTSTIGMPGSSARAMTVGAAYPGAFGTLQYSTPDDVIAWFSSRGGELSKPDILAPGVAYSTIPAWQIGEEVKGGTSMASPHIAGLAADLISAMMQEHQAWTAASLMQALRATARPLPGLTSIDEGPGMARIEPAYEWLRGGHVVARYRIEALPHDAGPTRSGMMPAGNGHDAAPMTRTPRPPGAYRRDGLAPGDTVQRFRVSELLPPGRHVATSPGFRLASDVPWLHLPSTTAAINAQTGSALVEVHYDRAALAQPGRYIGTVTAVSTADSSAGPAFTLTSTIIVPVDGGVTVHRQSIPGGQAARYFVRVPGGSGGLGGRMSLPDTLRRGTLYFFEPSGQPARGVKSEDVGGQNGRTATINILADDAVPGVWEMVVQALPGADLVFDLDARVSPVRRAMPGGMTGIGALNLGSATDTTMDVTVDLIGAARSEDITIENGAAVRRPLVVPEWATTLVVEVEVAPETWDQLTDFAITAFDSAGAQLGNAAMTYPVFRLAVNLPEDRPARFTTTIDLFPAFADPAPPARVAAHVRMRFEGAPRQVIAPAPLRLRAGGGTILPLPGMTPFDAPSGWQPVVRVRAGAGRDPFASTQLVTMPAGR